MQKVPRSFTLPGGYKVSVRQLGAREANVQMCDGSLAEWDVSDHTIYLRKERKMFERTEDFIHECEHAFVDWKDYFLGKSEQGDD